MTATMTPEQADLWLDSPLVRYVRDTYRPADTLELLEGLHLVCSELEDRYPGLPFRQIISTAQSPSPWPTLRALAANPDVSATDICTLFERYSYRKPAPSPGAYGRFEGMTGDYFAAVQEHGHSVKHLRSIGYGVTPANDMNFAWWWNLPDAELFELHSGEKRCRRRLEMQDAYDELVRMVICDDIPIAHVAPTFGVKPATASKICGAFLFQLWLATEGRLP